MSVSRFRARHEKKLGNTNTISEAFQKENKILGKGKTKQQPKEEKCREKETKGGNNHFAMSQKELTAARK